MYNNPVIDWPAVPGVLRLSPCDRLQRQADMDENE